MTQKNRNVPGEALTKLTKGLRLANAWVVAQSFAMHRIIDLFQQRGAFLGLQGSDIGLDDAIANLAAWMDLAGDRLTEDDWTALGEIGGVLYRDGMRRREGA